MHWRLKALTFRALEFPGGDAAHYFLQRYLTRTWPRPKKTLDALGNIARRVTDDYARHVGGQPRSVLEIGAGRDLAVPLALRNLGVERVITTDLNRIAKIELVQHAAKHLLTGQANFCDWGDLERFGISYLAPHRITASDEKVDCSCSNEVLEHVPPDQLVDLLKALRAVTTGITTHSIDYSDHYARADGKLSRFNFLRYSDEEWRKYNPPRQYVNRLRHSDYVRLFREAGFTILEEHAVPSTPPRVLEVNIDRKFKHPHYAAADVFTLRGRIVAR